MDGFIRMQHIQKLLNQRENEQSVFMSDDVLDAYATIRRTIEPVVNELKSESIFAKQVEFSRVADLVVTAYEEKNYAQVQEILQFTLVPRFKRLKVEVRTCFSTLSFFLIK